MSSYREQITNAAYGAFRNRFRLIPRDNDKCHGDEHLEDDAEELSPDDLFVISTIKQSLLKDHHLRAEIFSDKPYEDAEFMDIVNLICDWLDADTEVMLDMREVGRMMANLVNERFYKLAVEEFENE